MAQRTEWRGFSESTRDTFKKQKKHPIAEHRIDTHFVFNFKLGEWVNDMNLRIGARDAILPLVELDVCIEPNQDANIFTWEKCFSDS